MLPPLETRTETLPGDSGSPIVRVVFAGEGGAFADGHPHGQQMARTLKEAIEQHAPSGVIIDLQSLSYSGGDWIAWGALQSRAKGFPMCLVVKPSTEPIRELWKTCNLGTLIPVFPTVEEARTHLLSPEVQKQRQATTRSRIRLAYVKVESGASPGTYELVEEKTILGRHPECNLPLDCPSVARRHAAISLKEGAYLLEDQLSAGGTILNGVRITGPTELKNGDLIRMGGCELSFHVEEK